MCQYVHVETREVHLEHHFNSLCILIFETRTLTEPRFTLCARPANQQAPETCLFAHTQHYVYKQLSPPSIYMGIDDLNSDPFAFVEQAL